MIGIALTVGIACSSSKDTDPTPVRQFKITPASGASTASVSATPPSQPTTAGSPGHGTPASQATAATSPVAGTPASQATGTAQSTATSGGGGGGGTISIAASNLLFDKATLTASAGTVKIEFDNKDGGIPHNINVYDGKDASAKSLGSTAIEVGPTKQELTIDFKPGSYHFQCDVHPGTMTGTLTVS